MCLALLLERIWKHFVELSNNSIYSFLCRLKRLTMILHPKRLPNHCKSLHAKESENILKNYPIVDRWSSGTYHDQNYVTMTKMNVPWIFFKKNPNNILKNCQINRKMDFLAKKTKKKKFLSSKNQTSFFQTGFGNTGVDAWGNQMF